MTIWAFGIFVLHTVVAPLTALHALLYKREPRSALGWIAVCIFFPLFGPFLYYLFGINRVRTRASSLRSDGHPKRLIGFERPELTHIVPSCSESCESLAPELRSFGHLSDRITGRKLLGGNDVKLLLNGEGAYPPMLKAIRTSKHSVYLMSYLFEVDITGQEFVQALSDAVKRGVDVRVILDGIGDYYTNPRASRELNNLGIQVCLFLPPSLWPPSLYINLRNHRKLLLVDGEIGFAGGMNIGDRHLTQGRPVDSATQDIHFQFRGPLIRHLHELFSEMWCFITNESVPDFSGSTELTGEAVCRMIVDGPDEHLDQLELIMIGAIASARRSVYIMTPYFLPSREMVAALRTASLRDVQVHIILPHRSNLRCVQWATHNMLGELLMYGVRVYTQPPPFSHTKLLIIDDNYALVGSANIDPRSLRLNFELGIEIFSCDCINEMMQYFLDIRINSELYQLADLDGRSLPVRIRDAVCWLMSPYL